MSHTRFQYNTDLDRPLTHTQSRSNFIAIDRPDSSQFVDLHVYFLPKSFWKDRQNLAYNDAMEDAISAGFIRVPNQLSIFSLREEIEVQCGSDDAVPKEYIFLRSVGRAMTRVKRKQEYELKVKNFRPPQTYAPEIFLLEGKYDESNMPSTPNSTTSLNSPNINSTKYKLEPLKSSSNFNPYASTTSHRNTFNNSQNIFNENEEDNSREIQKLYEEQERLKRRQTDLERMRLEAERMQQLEEDRLKKIAEEENKFQKTKHNQQNYNNNNNHNNNNNNSKLKYSEKDLNDAATKIQSSYRGYSDRKKVKEIKNSRQYDMDKQNRLKEQQELEKKLKAEEAKRKNNDSGKENDLEYLRKKLEFAKSSRLELESVREELIKRLKQIHNRITLRRKEARDIWKKKYFAEKKKTPPFEEKIELQLNEIDSLQKKVIANLETDVKNAAQTGYLNETEIGSTKLASLKLQQEIDSLKRQVETTKLRLTTDIKLRNQAEAEGKALRTELAQTKVNLHHIKNKVSTIQNEHLDLLTARESVK